MRKLIESRGVNLKTKTSTGIRALSQTEGRRVNDIRYGKTVTETSVLDLKLKKKCSSI